MLGWVYIIESESLGSYYLGSTNNLQRRLSEHNSGRVTATRNKGPWKLVFNQKFQTLQKARKIEYKLKKMKSREILKKIITENKIRIN